MMAMPAHSGSTRFRSASDHHNSCNSATLSWFSAATLCACEKSVLRSYNSQGASRSGSQSPSGPNCLRVSGRKSHGMRSGFEAAHQPSLATGPAAEHLEILLAVLLRGVGLVEGVKQETRAVHGLLLDAVHGARPGIPTASSTVGAMSMQWVNWLRTFASGFTVPPPRDRHRVAGSAQVAGHLLAPLEGVFMACAQAAATCGAVWSPPIPRFLRSC